MARRRRLGGGLALLFVVASSACTMSSGGGPTPTPQALGGQTPGIASVVRAAGPYFPVSIARLVTATDAVSRPGGSHVVEHLSTSVRVGGGPTELLVLRQRRLAGVDWLEVRLPDRPNQAVGWIDANVTILRTTPWRIVVSTERRVVDVYWLGQHVRTLRAVVGAPASPTPHGLFAVLERVRTPDPTGFYGSWVITLTAHSTVYNEFEGGDGRVAIHGRGGTSLLDPLGSARSHGCVRVDNGAVDWLARVAGPGTPVEIV